MKPLAIILRQHSTIKIIDIAKSILNIALLKLDSGSLNGSYNARVTVYKIIKRKIIISISFDSTIL
jgi:hypothetical protein